ncbi:MAG: aminomethyl transferase family protein, partial [Gammaproteobacteria bacterium]|nr:aminomethyl transferase family protein [Gammaproteobacteria bacterium]
MTPHDDRMLLDTPFGSRVQAACELREWEPWKGYASAIAYEDMELEYFAVRNATGVFDLTPMTKYRIGGPDAAAFLNRLMTRDVGKIRPGRVGYAVWCNDAGMVLDDGTLFHLSRGDYRLCAQERCLDWLLTSALGLDLTIVDETAEVAALAVQGPTSCAALRAMGLEGLEALRPFGLRHYPFDGGELMVSRTGFTGDLGYEVWVAPAHAEALWDALFAAGRNHLIRPMGNAALELARIEAGFIQAGVDFVPAEQVVRHGRARSPFELGLDWLVDFDKGHFTGRGALLRERAQGSRFRFLRLDVEGNKPASESFILNKRGETVGHATSAAWCPSAKRNVALASLEMPWGRPEDELYAEIYT